MFRLATVRARRMRMTRTVLLQSPYSVLLYFAGHGPAPLTESVASIPPQFAVQCQATAVASLSVNLARYLRLMGRRGKSGQQGTGFPTMLCTCYLEVGLEWAMLVA